MKRAAGSNQYASRRADQTKLPDLMVAASPASPASQMKLSTPASRLERIKALKLGAGLNEFDEWLEDWDGMPVAFYERDWKEQEDRKVTQGLELAVEQATGRPVGVLKVPVYDGSVCLAVCPRDTVAMFGVTLPQDADGWEHQRYTNIDDNLEDRHSSWYPDPGAGWRSQAQTGQPAGRQPCGEIWGGSCWTLVGPPRWSHAGHPGNGRKLRAALARSCPEWLLRSLTRDRSSEVRYALACNPGCPVPALEKLLQDPNRRVSDRAADNPVLPPALRAMYQLATIR